MDKLEMLIRTSDKKDVDAAIAEASTKVNKNPFKKVTDFGGRSYEDDYYIKCLSCGACMIVGKCCKGRITQSMLDRKEIEQ